MTDLLLRGATAIATMNDEGDELFDADILIRDAKIAAVGKELDATGARIVDLTNQVVVPGLVNTHHHFFQSLTRAIPGAQDAELFDWLTALYPIWSHVTPEMVRIATRTAMIEMLLSGCTLTSDHHYLYPNGITLDDMIDAAAVTGMRFHATRGAMTVGQSEGGLPPDHLTENEDKVLADSERLIQRYHDPQDGAILRIALAPCSPFSVTRQLMRDTAELARKHGVMLHTHLAENGKDVDYSRERFGCTPAEYAEDLGWLGDDVWHAHCVKLDGNGARRFAQTQTGIAHCPCSNMRLASGIAPLRQWLDLGVPTGLGVDGSASNDAGHLLFEARQAMLLQRVMGDPAGLSAREALRTATRGGAEVLGRSDTGQISAGMMADLAIFKLDGIETAGALHDPIAALVFAPPMKAHHVICHGRFLVENGELKSLDLDAQIFAHNAAAKSLIAA